MRALWLWFLRQLHKLSIKIALWAKSKAESFDLPVPEARQAGQPPADWLARVQQANQPPAHWLEYIQSKTGQMPQMQDMSRLAQEQTANPKATLPTLQAQQPQAPKLKATNAPNWRKNPPKIFTEIDELPLPQSKEAAIMSYKSPTSSRLPEHLHWRIQKPAGKSVFDAPELQKGSESKTSYPDLQETSTTPVNYMQPEQTQGKKPRYRLLKAGMKSKVAYHTMTGSSLSEAKYWSMIPQAQVKETSYPTPQTSPDAKTAYQSPEVSTKSEAQFKAPEHPQTPETQYSQGSPTVKADAVYKNPENTAKPETAYPHPSGTYRDNSLDFATKAEKRDSSASFIAPEKPDRAEASYKNLDAPGTAKAPDYPASAASTASKADYASPKQAIDSGKLNIAKPRGSKSSVPHYSKASPHKFPATDSNYREAEETNHQQNPIGNSTSAIEAPHQANYTQAQSSQPSQTRFARTIPSDARSALANASTDYWIALPNESTGSDEIGAKSHQARLDAEQRGEF